MHTTHFPLSILNLCSFCFLSLRILKNLIFSLKKSKKNINFIFKNVKNFHEPIGKCMSQTIPQVCKAITICCEASNLLDSAKKIIDSRNQGEKDIEIASVATRSMALALNCVETTAQAYKTPASILEKIKTAELITRVIDLPVTLLKALSNKQHTLSLAIQEFFSSSFGIFRSANELTAYNAKKYLNMTPEQLKQEKREIIEIRQGEAVVIGHQPIEKEDCEQMLAQAERLAPTIQSVEAALKITELLSRNQKNDLYYYNLYESLLHQLRQEANMNKDPFNLLNLSYIPKELEDDVVFAKYQCTISHEPIRYPVGLPGEPQIYERENLVKHMKSNPTSPMTRNHFNLNQIQRKQAVHTIIDDRLKFHSERLRIHAQQNLTVPPNPDLQAYANNECPYYS
jgi:hypothetical protein